MTRDKHVRIRDCKGRQEVPVRLEDQANGIDGIDLLEFVRVLHGHGYSGPLNLEIVRAKVYSLEVCCMIAAEVRGHMQFCSRDCGIRLQRLEARPSRSAWTTSDF